MPEAPEPDGDEDPGDDVADAAADPADAPGHPLTARDAFPFLPKIID